MVVTKNTMALSNRLPVVKISVTKYFFSAWFKKINWERGNLFVNEIVMYINIVY